MAKIFSVEANGGPTSSVDSTGCTLIAAWVRPDGAPAPPFISDSEANTWTARTAVSEPSFGIGGRWFYCENPTTDAAHTFTSGYGSLLIVIGFSEVDTSGGAFDKETTSTTGGGGASSLTVSSTTPSQTGSLLLSGISLYSDAGARTDPVLGGGWTTDEAIDWAGSGRLGGGLGHLIQAAPAGVTAPWTWTGGTAYVPGSIIVFKYSGSGGGGSSNGAARHYYAQL